MLEKICKIAKKAGNIIIDACCNTSDISNKPGDANFVTKYDIKVQEFLNIELTKLFPDSVFAGEENDSFKFSNKGICIIVDPIDGTTNFIKNYKHSCVSIAILEDGIQKYAVVYDPYLDEMFTAERCKGAHLNNRRINISENGIKNSLIIFGTSPYYENLPTKTFDIIKDIFPVIGDVRRSGSAALDICYIAAARADLFFELVLSPWDFAAASLILKEAGGIIKTANDSDISFEKPIPIIASSKKTYLEFLDITNNSI